jgi:hypothetical protein
LVVALASRRCDHHAFEDGARRRLHEGASHGGRSLSGSDQPHATIPKCNRVHIAGAARCLRGIGGTQCRGDDRVQIGADAAGQ